MKEEMFDNEILVVLKDFDIIRCDRNTQYDTQSYKTKGGCAIIYPKDLCVTKAKHWSNGVNESICVELKELNTSIVAIYRPPSANIEKTMDTLQSIDHFLSTTKMPNLILACYYNMPNEELYCHTYL